MHPSMLYEIAFNLVAIAAILRWHDRVPVTGDAVKLYLLCAGVFRFLVEGVRGNEPQALGLTGPQWVLIPLIALLALHFVRQAARRAWQVPIPTPGLVTPASTMHAAPALAGVQTEPREAGT
jgi:prolipoprotein diacylglyceryltransferase